jgi:hypothetical protein
MNCPWSNLARGSTKFCEATLCGWIESPAIAWAAVAYVLAGIYLLRQVQKDDHWLLQLFPWFAFSMGMSSFLYHASHAFIFQAWALASMYLLGTAIVMLNFRRLLWPNGPGIFFTLLTLEMLLFMWLQAQSASYILGSLIVFYFLLEFLLRKSRAHWRDFQLTLGLFALSLGALWMERSSGMCQPDNHFFQWHAVWDIFCAGTYVTLFRHFKRVY